MKRASSILLLLLLACSWVSAQKLVETREQAQGWYVPVIGKVTAEGSKATHLNVQFYKGDRLLDEFTSDNGKFHLELDLNNTFTLILSKDGYLTKMLQFDTHVPDTLVVYPAYGCFADLESSEKFTHSDPFYLDFPSALISWDGPRQGFYHSMGYLTDIRAKVAMLQAQMDPK